MANTSQIQQGDVLLEKISSVPRGARKVELKDGRIILAEGETHGHHHAIADAHATAFELNGQMYVEVKEASVILTHEEHKHLPIPIGIYRVGRVQEYDHLTQMTRKVVD